MSSNSLRSMSRWSAWVLAALPIMVSAAPGGTIRPAVERLAHDAHSFITGPSYEVPAVDDRLTCEQLYAGIVSLTSQTYSYHGSYWDDPRNAAILAAGFVVTPAFYALGYTAMGGYAENQRVRDVNMQLDALRQASARKQCWVR